jgi:hypothetical protein
LAQPHVAKRTALEAGGAETDPVEIAPIKATFAINCLGKSSGLAAAEVAGHKLGTSEVAGIKTAPSRDKNGDHNSSDAEISETAGLQRNSAWRYFYRSGIRRVIRNLNRAWSSRHRFVPDFARPLGVRFRQVELKRLAKSVKSRFSETGFRVPLAAASFR